MSQVGYFIFGTSVMLVMILAIISFVYIYQQKLNRKNADYKAIEALIQQNELKSAYAVIEGQERERKRIAAELHDNVGGLISTLHIFSDLALKEQSLSEAHRLNIKVNALSLQLIGEIRKLAYELDLRTLSGFGLKTALEQLCESVHSTGKVRVSAVIELSHTLPEKVAVNLYRIIQELFTNTLKHAEAVNVRLELAGIGEEISLIYEDDGKGFEMGLVVSGMGLENIRKRTAAIEGLLTVDSSALGSTFIIEATL